MQIPGKRVDARYYSPSRSNNLTYKLIDMKGQRTFEHHFNEFDVQTVINLLSKEAGNSMENYEQQGWM